MIKLGTNTYERYDRLLSAALRKAITEKIEPKCDCTRFGIPLQIVNHSGKLMVRKGKDTGPLHAIECEFFQLPNEFMGYSIRDNGPFEIDEKTGIMKISVDFQLTKIIKEKCEDDNEKQNVEKKETGEIVDNKNDRSKINLANFLNFILEKAELNLYVPTYRKRKTWIEVRNMLSSAAGTIAIKSNKLEDALFIPETFDLENINEIITRQNESFKKFIPISSDKKNLMILLAEVRDFYPSRYICDVIFKHMPDCRFKMSLELLEKLNSKFFTISKLWNRDENHLLSLAIVEFSDLGSPRIIDMTVVLTNLHWIPFNDEMEMNFLQVLMKDGRNFVQILPSDTSYAFPRPFLVLKDTGKSTTPVYVLHDKTSESVRSQIEAMAKKCSGVIWWVDRENFPKLSAKAK